MTLKILLIIATLAGFSMCFDEVIITLISVEASKIQIKCTVANLTINGKVFEATSLTDGSRCLFEPTATQTIPATNASIWLRLDPLNAVTPFSGTFSVNQTAAVNTLHSGIVVLQEETVSIPTTATPPTTHSPNTTTTQSPTRSPIINGNATLTINYIRIQYNDDVKKEAAKNNGAAVTVAVIEGIALIAILAYLGYQTMKAQKMKNNAAMEAAAYGFSRDDNAVRMSDIPPSREPIPTPVFSTRPQLRNSAVTATPDLVVPTTSGSQNQSQSHGTFNDPFSSLENW